MEDKMKIKKGTSVQWENKLSKANVKISRLVSELYLLTKMARRNLGGPVDGGIRLPTQESADNLDAAINRARIFLRKIGASDATGQD
jgi:hypothetical protein